MSWNGPSRVARNACGVERIVEFSLSLSTTRSEKDGGTSRQTAPKAVVTYSGPSCCLAFPNHNSLSPDTGLTEHQIPMYISFSNVELSFPWLNSPGPPKM